MARFRLLLLGLASGSAFYSGITPALGLGEINLHSALNQPLDAEIELLQLGDLGEQDIKVRLASAEEFSRIGVERFYFLNDLRFTPVLRGGRGLIRVQSNKPVREPYLNFVVEVARPGGNLLREYTVLIDPPGSSAYTSQAAPLPAPVARTWRRDPARPLPQAVNGERYQVQRGDSLWTIAGRLQGNGVAGTREALMGDILALNPQAFSNGDPDRLRAGAQLLLPDSARSAPVVETVAVPAPASVASQEAPAASVVDPQPQVEQTRLETELAQVNAQNLQLQNTLSQLQEQLQQLQTQMAEKDLQMQQIRTQLEQQATPTTPVVPEAPPVIEPRGIAWGLWLAAALALLLLLVGLAWRVRRRQPHPEPQPQRRPPAEPRMESRPVVQQAKEVEAPMPVHPVPVALASPLLQPKVQSTTDPLEGANIYIAYGRFADAANSLRKAIEQQPDRLDLRLRMLEVCGELGDAGAFFEHEQQLREMGASHVQVDQIRARYSNLPQTQVAPAAPVDVMEAEPVALLQDDFQLNLDDLSLDADWGLASPFQPEQSARVKVEKARQDLLDPDFRSNLRELPEVAEMSADDGLLASFAELPQEQVLDADFIDAFASEQVVRQPAQGIEPMSGDLDHLAGNRDHLVRLNTALAYIEQGDIGSACDILNELISQGDEQQRERARELLAKIA